MQPPAAVEFVLPRGYRDRSGVCHRRGAMRPATARDEVRALQDFRAHLQPDSLLDVLLARVVIRLGSLPRADAGLIARLDGEDRGLLERLYLTLNGYGPPEASP